MKAIAAFSLGMVGLVGLAAGQDKEAPKLEGKYTLVAGKVNGKDVADESKKAEYTLTADKITIAGGDFKFVIGYRLDPKTTPTNVDMEILEGPEGAKGLKALGIVEAKDGVVKLAYAVGKEKDEKDKTKETAKRPKDFKGEKDFYFELKKAK